MVGSYALTCFKGEIERDRSRRFFGPPPLEATIEMSFRKPDYCSITMSADYREFSGGEAIRLKVFARKKNRS